jgi:hypothetical protein
VAESKCSHARSVGALSLQIISCFILMTNSQLPLSMTTDSLPLTIPTTHPISTSLVKSLGSGLPQRPQRASASSAWKVFVRTGAATTAGHALEHIYSRQHGLEPDKPYDDVDAIVNRCISMLVVKPDSPDMFHCDAVPMVFW